MDASPNARHDRYRFINVWRDFDARDSKLFRTSEAGDPLSDKRVGYDACTPKRDVILSFRRHGKLSMASAESLAIVKGRKRSFAGDVEDVKLDVQTCCATRQPTCGKSESSLRSQMKLERLASRARGRQRGLGFLSDARAEAGASKLSRSVKPSPSDFRSATTIKKSNARVLIDA